MVGVKYLVCVLALAFTLLLPDISQAQQLSTSFYSSTCPSVYDIVKSNVRSAVNREKRIGASILRLIFHDCFVVGCDAGVLLDDNPPTIDSEKKANANMNSLRGFELIDKIKDAVDKACAGPVVSCADIIAIAARDSVVELGGPTWQVPLGRRDARSANRSAAESDLPAPFSDLKDIISSFSAKGFTPKEMVALSGSHSIGLAQCKNFRNHLYNGTNLDGLIASERKSRCPSNGGDDVLESLDQQSPNRFGNNYFQALLKRRGLLHSDQELFNGGSVDDIVRSYSQDSQAFYTDFANAMTKMGNLNPLTGSQGEVRKNCRRLN